MGTPGSKHIVGFDGGGSGCRAVLTNADGVVIGRASGKPANIASDFSSACRNITGTIVAAYRKAGRPLSRIADDVAVLGLAGFGVGDFSDRLGRELGFFRQRITDDREITVEGALGPGDGCVAMLGTGSFFTGRHGGKTTRIGGWGFQLGDDGSGAQLGRELLRRTILCHDGLAAHSRLTREILRQFGGTPTGIVEFGLRAQPKDYGEFAPQLVTATEAGDTVAMEILAAARDHVQRALDAVGLARGGPLCLLGGLGPTCQRLLDLPYQALVRPAKGDALDGAVALARREFAAELEAGR